MSTCIPDPQIIGTAPDKAELWPPTAFDTVTAVLTLVDN